MRAHEWMQPTQRAYLRGKMRTMQQVHCSAWGVKKVTLARLYSTRNRKGTDLWPMSRIGVRQTPGLFCSIGWNQIDWAWSMHSQTHQKLRMQGWFYWPCCSKVAGWPNGEELIYARACRSLQEVTGALQEFVQCADTYNNSSPLGEQQELVRRKGNLGKNSNPVKVCFLLFQFLLFP